MWRRENRTKALAPTAVFRSLAALKAAYIYHPVKCRAVCTIIYFIIYTIFEYGQLIIPTYFALFTIANRQGWRFA